MRIGLAVGLLGACALAGCGGSGAGGGGAVASGPPCGRAGPGVLAATAGRVARRIYHAEVASAEVSSDRRQVESYAPLLHAVASGAGTATATAVSSLVFSHTHLVRLRVMRGSRVLADVGGPDVLAPVGGVLRYRGRSVGSYVLSVQDDLGYLKLATRFIGVPVLLRAGPRQLMSTIGAGPARIPASGPVSYGGVDYRAYSFAARAFPAGPLRISLLIPAARADASVSCAEVAARELGDVARRASLRFMLSPQNFGAYDRVVHTLTRALLFIRTGTRQLAGSVGPSPGTLPRTGSVRFRGARYRVFSFPVSTGVGAARVYQLIAQ